MAAVAKKATSFHDRSGTYSICKEEVDRIVYTCTIPSGSWKKKKMIKRKRIEQSTLTLFQQTLEEEEDDDKEEEDEREDTHIKLLASQSMNLWA